jgi:hypothetical protein
MFDSLSDQMKADELSQTTSRGRAVRYTVMAVLSVVLFGGLYLVVRLAS